MGAVISRTNWGIRLVDVRFEESWTVDVPARSLDHAEEVINWHNDPRNESCYEAALVVQYVTTTNWELAEQPARNAIT